MVAMHLFKNFHGFLRTSGPPVEGCRKKGHESEGKAHKRGLLLLSQPEHISELGREDEDGNGPKRSMSCEEVNFAHVPIILSEM